MDKLLDKLPAFALPFVTRSLRGSRAKRYLVFSAVLTGMTMIIGLWIALGAGDFEREMRTSLDFETPMYERERDELTVLAMDAWQQRDYEESRAVLEREGLAGLAGHNTYTSTAGTALLTAAVALEKPAYGEQHRALQLQLRTLLERRAPELLEVRKEAYHAADEDYPGSEPYYDYDEAFSLSYGFYVGHDYFEWTDPEAVARMQTLVERDGIPEIEVYSSPLGLEHALGIAGMLAGFILMAVGTVLAPILVAVQQAQERNENTLMPLTATALNPRELALGLSAGPIAVALIFVVPQLGVFALGALAMGYVVPALGFLGVLTGASVLLTLGAQLVGDLVGTKRTPGIVGIALMVLAVATWSFGATLGMEAYDYDHDIAGLAALLPHAGLTGFYLTTWYGGGSSSDYFYLAALANAGGCLVAAHLVLSALSKRIAGRSGPLLTRGQAVVGALTFIVLANLAMPLDAEIEMRQYIGLGILSVPFIVLLMARVPLGDTAPKLRSVPVMPLLGELGAWSAAQFILIPLVYVGLFSPELHWDLEVFHPVGLVWLTWSIAVTGLIAIRLASAPNKILSNVWLAFCAMTVVIAFIHAVLWGVGEFNDIDEVFAMAELSPVLGLLQAALAVWIPISLVRQLRSVLGGIR